MNKTEDFAALAARARDGDADAFGRLYEQVYADLYRYAVYQLGQTQAAEDAVQETALEAFRHIRNLKSPEAFRSWIFTILNARCNRGIRDLIRQRNQAPLEDSPLSAEDFAGQSDDGVRLRAAIAALGDLDRRLLLLSVVGGFSGREIARILGRPEGTLRSRLHRCLKKLRAVLDDGEAAQGKEASSHETART